jgi:hypothetical protein
MLVRTTLRLDASLKKQAEMKALEDNTTLQELFNRALRAYLQRIAKKKAKKIKFITFDLGEPLDNLTRADFYPDPKL